MWQPIFSSRAREQENVFLGLRLNRGCSQVHGSISDWDQQYHVIRHGQFRAWIRKSQLCYLVSALHVTFTLYGNV